jgi:protein SCO1/2
MISDRVLKYALLILVALLALVFVWQPLSKTLSKAAISHDFVLETVQGALDSRQERGKVMAVMFAYANCGDDCADRLTRLARAYDQINSRDRDLVRLVVVSVDPERDTAAAMDAYVHRFHGRMTGAAVKADALAALAEGFAVSYKKGPVRPDGSYDINHSHPIFLIDPEGRFASALNENLTPEQIAQALRGKVPALLPPR